LLKSFGAGVDRFKHRPLADFIAKAGGLEILYDRLFSGFLRRIVDGKLLLGFA
jgi:hypothetical protein